MTITPDTPAPFTAWAVTRQRVRAGHGPRKVTINGLTCATREGVRMVALCHLLGRGYVGPDELHATEREAQEATEEAAAIELRHEQAKFNAIEKRLSTAFFAAGKRVAELADTTTTRTE